MEQLLQVDEASESVEELKKPRSLKRVTSSPSAKKRSRIANKSILLQVQNTDVSVTPVPYIMEKQVYWALPSVTERIDEAAEPLVFEMDHRIASFMIIHLAYSTIPTKWA